MQLSTYIYTLTPCETIANIMSLCFRTCTTLTNGTEKKKKKKRKQGARSLETLAKPQRSSELLSQVCVCVFTFACMHVMGCALGVYVTFEEVGCNCIILHTSRPVATPVRKTVTPDGCIKETHWQMLTVFILHWQQMRKRLPLESHALDHFSSIK